MSTTLPNTSAATTDVGEFMTDLDGGQFERMLSVALSQVAAGTVDNDGKGEVTLKLSFSNVPGGASQVICAHKLTFVRPTANGKASEEVTRKTVLHVGRAGRMSIVPETQAQMFTRQGEPATQA